MTPMLFLVTGSPLDSAEWAESFRPVPAPRGSRAAGAAGGPPRVGVSSDARRVLVAGPPVVRVPRPVGDAR